MNSRLHGSLTALSLLGLLLDCSCTAKASATNIYIAQSAAGSANGTSCANAYAYTFFNTSSNWGSGANQIGPGTTVNLCGTFTASAGASNYLTFQGSGSGGNPITLFFEPGAILEAPYWSGAAINLNGESYLTINGGTNGTIEATANGTSLTYQQDYGVGIGSSADVSNVTIEDMTIQNVYVRNCGGAPCSDAGGGNTSGIQIWTGSNDLVEYNTVHDVHWAIVIDYGGSATTSSNVRVTQNTIYNMDHGVIFGDQGSNSVLTSSGCSSSIDNNDLSGMEAWDNTADDFHHDAVHTWANNTPGSHYSGVCIYDNYVHGNNGQYPSGMLFIESLGSSNYIFNNVIDLTQGGYCADGAIAKGTGTGAKGSGNFYLNNTIIPGSQCLSDIGLQETSGETVENNLFQTNTQAYVYTDGTSGDISVSNYNVYGLAQGANPFYGPSGCTSGASFSAWQSPCGFDPNGKLATVSLNSNYTLPSGSPAFGAGTNLTSLGITPLSTGAPLTFGVTGSCGSGGCVARPQTGAWDAGAYEYSAAAPNPPTGLTATAH